MICFILPVNQVISRLLYRHDFIYLYYSKDSIIIILQIRKLRPKG